MTKLPLLSASQLEKILKKLGFDKIRHKASSHMFFRHADGRTTTVPCHPGEKIDRGLLNKIIKKDIGITREEFFELL